MYNIRHPKPNIKPLKDPIDFEIFHIYLLFGFNIYFELNEIKIIGFDKRREK